VTVRIATRRTRTSILIIFAIAPLLWVQVQDY
jgi:hypothetical protein